MGAMRPCQGVAGNGKRQKRPCAAPLPWFPVFAGTTMGVCGSASAGGVGVGAPSTGSGRTDLGSGPSTGSGGCDGGGDAPRRAPLDTGFRRYDDGGLRVGKCWRCWGAGAPFECPQDRLRQAQGERTWGAGLRRGMGDAMGEETPRAAPLWIPAFAGTTMGVCGSASAGGVGVRGPPSSALRTGFDRLRGNGLGERACDGELGMRGGGDAPRRAPLDTGFRRYDDGGGRGLSCGGGAGLSLAPSVSHVGAHALSGTETLSGASPCLRGADDGL